MNKINEIIFITDGQFEKDPFMRVVYGHNTMGLTAPELANLKSELWAVLYKYERMMDNNPDHTPILD